MFLFAAITSLADIIKRGRNHEALTGGEAALLRLFDGVTVALLLAAWGAFQMYGPALPQVHDIAGATMAAVLLAWQKWAAGSGLAQLEAGIDPASGNVAAGPAPAATAGVAPGGSAVPEPPSGATAFARSAPAPAAALADAIMAKVPPTVHGPFTGWAAEPTPGTAPAAPYVPHAAALLSINGTATGETEGAWEDGEEPVPPGASGRYRTLADMPQPATAPPLAAPSAITQPATPAPGAQTPGWLLDQPVTQPVTPPSQPSALDPGATVLASIPPAAPAPETATAAGAPHEEGPNQ